MTEGSRRKDWRFVPSQHHVNPLSNEIKQIAGVMWNTVYQTVTHTTLDQLDQGPLEAFQKILFRFIKHRTYFSSRIVL